MSRISPDEYSFTRYLAAKKSVDDRALNEYTWQALARALPQKGMQVLEIGAGIGTMVERIIERRLFAADVAYTAIDTQPANIDEARRRLRKLPKSFTLQLEAIDLFDFAAREQGHKQWDLLIAHAFLDLMDLPRALPLLFSLLKPDGLFYFTLNFDGATILQPLIDPEIDPQIMALYHRTMDERIIDGHRSGTAKPDAIYSLRLRRPAERCWPQVVPTGSFLPAAMATRRMKRIFYSSSSIHSSRRCRGIRNWIKPYLRRGSPSARRRSRPEPWFISHTSLISAAGGRNKQDVNLRRL